MDDVYRALSGAVAGQPGADTWLLDRGASLAGHLAQVFMWRDVPPSWDAAASSAQRQLAGLMLGRMAEKEVADAEQRAALTALFGQLREACGRLVLGGEADDPAVARTACALLADILRGVTDEGAEGLVAACASSDSPHAERFLHALTARSLPKGSLGDVLHRYVVAPAVSGPAYGKKLALARAAFVAAPQRRTELTQSFQQVLARLPVADPELVADAMQIATLLQPPIAAALYPAAARVFAHYAEKIADAGRPGGAPLFTRQGVAGFYSDLTAVRNTVMAVAAFASTVTPGPEFVQCLPCVVECAAENALEEFDDGDEESTFDCACTIDAPENARDACVWLVSLLLRDPEDDGPSPPVPNAAVTVSAVLRQGVEKYAGQPGGAKRANAYLLALEKVCEAEQLPPELVPIDLLRRIAASAAVDSATRARACLAASAVANKLLPPESHAELINLQWQQLCDPSTPEAVRITLARGIGNAVAHVVVNPQALPLVQIGPSLDPFLKVFQEAPALLVGALDTLLQVLGARVFTPQNAGQILNVLLSVMAREQRNTRLCGRILRLLCHGVIEEHEPGALCETVQQCSSFVLNSIFPSSDPSLEALVPGAMDVASALCCCKCSCAASSKPLVAAIAGFKGTDAQPVRNASRAFALACSTSARLGSAPAEDAIMSFLSTHVADGRYDLATAAVVAAACASLASHLGRERLEQLARCCTLKLGGYWAVQRGWNWPAALCVPWCALVARGADVREALAAVGSTEAEQLQYFEVWLTLDAILEPSARPVSAAAASTLLTSLPQKYLTATVQLACIKTLTTRTSPDQNITVQLGDALLLAVYRLCEKPLCPYLRSFLAKHTSLSMPVDSQVCCLTSSVKKYRESPAS
ncbi:hypothetical protein DIPPA_03596 [Diplonema papillatum]|nr:hypothetical protein DIPPA_03596 [Diplonema papillatum]